MAQLRNCVRKNKKNALRKSVSRISFFNSSVLLAGVGILMTPAKNLVVDCTNIPSRTRKNGIPSNYQIFLEALANFVAKQLRIAMQIAQIYTTIHLIVLFRRKKSKNGAVRPAKRNEYLLHA